MEASEHLSFHVIFDFLFFIQRILIVNLYMYNRFTSVRYTRVKGEATLTIETIVNPDRRLFLASESHRDKWVNVRQLTQGG